MARAMVKSAKFAREVEAAHRTAGIHATTMHQDTTVLLGHMASHDEDVEDSEDEAGAEDVVDGDVAVAATITPIRRVTRKRPTPLEKRVARLKTLTKVRPAYRKRERT